MNEKIVALLNETDSVYTMHAHPQFRTVVDMVEHLGIAPEQTLKTVALWVKNGDYLLVAVRGSERVDYKKIAKWVGVSRRNVRPMAADDVLDIHGYVVGGVSPFVWREDAKLLLDSDVAPEEIVYTGGGTVTTTLEIKLADLLAVNGAAVLDLRKVD